MSNMFYTYEVTRSLDEDMIKDILTTAIEGGIGYWACLGNDDPDWIAARDKYKEEHNDYPCYCDVAYELLSNNKSVIFYDEQDDNTKLELTMGKLLLGCGLFEEQYKTPIIQMFDNASFDAYDADCIIQYALFGEVIYGQNV